MKDIERVNRRFPGIRVTDRELASRDNRAVLRVGQARTVSDLQAVKVNALCQVAQRAMQSVAFLSQAD